MCRAGGALEKRGGERAGKPLAACPVNAERLRAAAEARADVAGMERDLGGSDVPEMAPAEADSFRAIDNPSPGHFMSNKTYARCETRIVEGQVSGALPLAIRSCRSAAGHALLARKTRSGQPKLSSPKPNTFQNISERGGAWQGGPVTELPQPTAMRAATLMSC